MSRTCFSERAQQFLSENPKFCFPSDPNQFYISRHPAPHRGAFRDRHGREEGCGGRGRCQKTNDVARGRRSRVVLTPRLWRQVRGFNLRATVARKPGHRGERENKLLKPLRGECRGRAQTVVATP